MRTYLSVPYSEKDEAKTLGAKWDPKKKQWYAPNSEPTLLERWPLNEVPIHELVGEDRMFGGNQLFVDLVPSSCWFTNVRKCVHPSDWERLRHFVYARANYQCECCFAKGSLEAHERWYFDDKLKIQKLMRIICLCKACHETTHMGLAQIKGRGDIAMQHLIKVTHMDQKTADNHVKEAFDLWYQRNQFSWELDLTIITNSGIKLTQQFNKNVRASFAQNEIEQQREQQWDWLENDEQEGMQVRERATNYSQHSSHDAAHLNPIAEEPAQHKRPGLFNRIKMLFIPQ